MLYGVPPRSRPLVIRWPSGAAGARMAAVGFFVRQLRQC